MVSQYTETQKVNISDPSGRLGLQSFNFPYTPNISVSSSTNYATYDLTHTNLQQMAFQSGNNPEISLTAPIIVRNEDEANSVISGSRFFRAAMKMGFGENDPLRGLPPPIMRFNAYGVYTNVPVLIREFVWNFDADTDYLETSGGISVPVVSTFVVGLITTYGTKNVRQNFTLRDYANGNLNDKGYI